MLQSWNFKRGSESGRGTEGYRLVLVIAQRVRVINNKGGKGEGHQNITGTHNGIIKAENLISALKYHLMLNSNCIGIFLLTHCHRYRNAFTSHGHAS